MYTVVRFTGMRSAEDLRPLGPALQEEIPELYSCLRIYPDCFSCSLSKAETWSQHRGSILTLIGRCGEFFGKLANLGIALEFDTAIERGDVPAGGPQRITIDPELARALDGVMATMVVTIYD